jgi:hypothetical protein
MLKFESEMTTKHSYIKGLVARLWCYWKVVEPLGGGDPVVISQVLEENIGITASSLPLCFTTARGELASYVTGHRLMP